MQLTATIFAGEAEPRLRKAHVALTPAQEKIAGEVLAGLSMGAVCLLRAKAGMGKTTVLRHLQRELGAALVSIRDLLQLLRHRPPVAIEDTFMEVLDSAMFESDVVLVDDLHLLTAVVNGFNYDRTFLLDAVIAAVLAEADVLGKKFVFATEGREDPESLRERALVWEMDDFEVEDFASFCSFYVGEKASALDFGKIHRFAPALNGYQLRNGCLWLLRQREELSTGLFVEHLRAQNLASNVDLDEVEDASWADLKGMEDLVEELEAKIALPFDNDELAVALDLKPKRGVLLAGPPGTGKTTIGRALARRLKGKFFLIDGTINAESSGFYDKVSQIFGAAAQNAPSVIFIDDADVIFEAGHEGLYRYLLTKMDGLASASTGCVCVMLTAMDVAAVPPALLRAGRVELWLQTRLPDEGARKSILEEKFVALPQPVGAADVSLLALQSRGLSGADLKSVVEEGKLLYARALTTGKDCLPVEQFFLRAIESCRANRRGYGLRKKPAFDGGRFGFPV